MSNSETKLIEFFMNQLDKKQDDENPDEYLLGICLPVNTFIENKHSISILS